MLLSFHRLDCLLHVFYIVCTDWFACVVLLLVFYKCRKNITFFNVGVGTGEPVRVVPQTGLSVLLGFHRLVCLCYLGFTDLRLCYFLRLVGLCMNLTSWIISIATLNALRHLHLRPIYRVVCPDPYGESLSWEELGA